MAMLHRFTLKRNKTEGGWELKDQTGEVIKTFETKAEALAGGPRSRDPRASPG